MVALTGADVPDAGPGSAAECAGLGVGFEIAGVGAGGAPDGRASEAAEHHIRCRSCRKPRSRMTCSNEHAEVWQQAVPSALEVAEEEQEGRKEAKRRESLELSRVES